MGAQMGLIFSIQTLNNLHQCYKEFKNSVIVVYDLNKANYGMNPLKSFRLSEKAVNFLSNTSDSIGPLVQDVIRLQNMTIADFFEEIPVRIHRSHLIQAFLFDHVLPHMPAFNTNMFKLASGQYLSSHVYHVNEITDDLVLEE